MEQGIIQGGIHQVDVVIAMRTSQSVITRLVRTQRETHSVFSVRRSEQDRPRWTTVVRNSYTTISATLNANLSKKLEAR